MSVISALISDQENFLLPFRFIIYVPSTSCQFLVAPVPVETFLFLLQGLECRPTGTFARTFFFKLLFLLKVVTVRATQHEPHTVTSVKGEKKGSITAFAGGSNI